jgi:diketogulonate reductase-like aldo/keto reductase
MTPGPLEPFDLSRGPAGRTRLSDGVEMPYFGLGVYQARRGRETEQAVAAALGCGYRLIDTAALYRNEAEVGAAVRAFGLPREEVFVTTKLWNDDQGRERAAAGFEKSRAALDLGAVDLYLLHWPVAGRRLESWSVLEGLLARGACRAIGVSNFTIRHLEELLARSSVVPAVNQVEFSPFLYQRELLEFCRRRGIQLEAYAPLTRGERLGDPVLAEVARSHGKTPAQVILRWALQHDVIVIPKSVHAERIRENAGLFDFALSASEMRRLDGLDEGLRTTWDPSEMP